MRNGRIDVPVRMRIIERSSWGNLCSLKKTIETRVQFRQVQIKSFDLYGILYTTYTYVVAPDEAALVVFRHEGFGQVVDGLAIDHRTHQIVLAQQLAAAGFLRP